MLLRSGRLVNKNCVKKQAALPSSEDTRNPKFDGEVLLETLYRDGLAIIDDLLPQDLLDQCIKDVFFEFARDFGSDGLVELGKDPVARRDLNTRSDRVVSLPTNLQQCPGLKALYNILSNEVLARLNLAFLAAAVRRTAVKDELVYLHGHEDIAKLKFGEPQLTCYPAERQGKFVRHVDDYGATSRRITMIFYLNKGWQPSHGGKLRTWTGKEIWPNNLFSGRNGVREIEPIANRLVLFWSDAVPHEVMPAFRDRYAITVWNSI